MGATALDSGSTHVSSGAYDCITTRWPGAAHRAVGSISGRAQGAELRLVENSTYRHLTEHQVRFADLDAMGHLNNIALVQLLETARVDYMVELGLGAHDELTYAIVSLQCDFRAQAHFHDRLTCGTRMARLGARSFVLEHEVWKQDGTTVATSTTTLVTLAEDPTRSAPIPEDWPERLERFERRPVPVRSG